MRRLSSALLLMACDPETAPDDDDGLPVATDTDGVVDTDTEADTAIGTTVVPQPTTGGPEETGDPPVTTTEPGETTAASLRRASARVPSS